MGKRSRCWAETLGGCGVRSGAHLISESALPEGELVVEIQGFGLERALRSQIKSNVLCGRHNSALSPVDAELKAFSAFTAMAYSSKRNSQAKFDGLLLERAMLVTAINFSAAGFTEAGRRVPNERLVRAAFGVEPIPAPVGLYTVAPLIWDGSYTHGFTISDQFVRAPDGTQHLGGFFMYTNGVPLYYSMGLHDFKDAPADAMQMGTSLRELDLRYHATSLLIVNESGVESRFDLSWNDFCATRAPA